MKVRLDPPQPACLHIVQSALTPRFRGDFHLDHMSRKAIDLTGQRFGRLTVIEQAPSRGHFAVWKCRCDCGVAREVRSQHLRSGSSRSCGCLAREMTRKSVRKHGLSHSREWNAWTNARSRCHNPNNPRFRDYGARGIQMCPEWRSSFAAFYAYVGPCPPRLTLDRINNDGNYEPGNVRWATRAQQARNKRNVRVRIAQPGNAQPEDSAVLAACEDIYPPRSGPHCARTATFLETHEHQQHSAERLSGCPASRCQRCNTPLLALPGHRPLLRETRTGKEVAGTVSSRRHRGVHRPMSSDSSCAGRTGELTDGTLSASK